LNVNSYGAVGDAVTFNVNTVSNSATVTVNGTNTFTSSDVGKLIEVFTAGANFSVGCSNQDILDTITSVSANGTNITFSTPCQHTYTNIPCTIGRNNATNFQNCVNAAQYLVNGGATNVAINIPSGSYLLIDTNALNLSGNWNVLNPSSTITSGGLTFLGGSNTVLLGCGAGVTHHDVNDNINIVMRSELFFITAPVSNPQYPVMFSNLVFDGGVQNGLQGYQYFPPLTVDGQGWDVSHHALLWYDTGGAGTAQSVQKTIFTNCVFQHWRGEMLIGAGITGGTNTTIEIGNCTFNDGNASALNPDFAHNVHHNTFANLVKVFEWFESRATSPSYFQYNYWTNIVGTEAYTIVGSLTNAQPQPDTINSNVFFGSGNAEIAFSPAENVTVSSNVFLGSGGDILLQATGEQPSDGTQSGISNIVINANALGGGIVMDGIDVNGVCATNNTGLLVAINGGGYGYAGTHSGGFKTNVIFYGNAGQYLDSVNVGSGSFFYDTNNVFSGWWADYNRTTFTSPTNVVYYGLGGKYHLIKPDGGTGGYWAVDDLNTSLMPTHAQLQISNTVGGTLVLHSLVGGGTIASVANGGLANLNWNGTTFTNVP